MKKLAFAVITALAVQGAVAEESSVYRPQLKSNGLKSMKSVGVQHGMLGAAYASTLTSNNEVQAGVMMNTRYFAGERWYVLGELQIGEFSSSAVVVDGEVLREEKEDALRYAFGAGYAILQGSASTSGQYAIPWAIAAELAAGEQYSGATSGQYTALGLSVQFHGPRVWTALGVREFSIADERLKTLGSDRGMQWDISLGMWF